MWQFYLLFGCIDFFLAAISSVPLSYLVGKWYTDKRGTMTATVFVGVNLGGVIMSPVMEHVIGAYGWKCSVIASGILIAVVAIPLSLFVIRRDPASVGQRAFVYPEEQKKACRDTEAKSDFEGVARKVAVKSPTFYLLAFGLICLGMVSAGIMVHIPNHLGSLGMNYGVIVAVLSVAAIFGTLLNGLLFDKMGAIGGMFVTTVFLVIGSICLFMVGKIAALAYLMAITVGFSICVANTGPPLLTSTMYGMKDYSKLFGYQYAMFLAGCMLGPITSGAIYDKTQSYDLVWIVFIVVSILMFISLFAAVKGAKHFRKGGAQAK